MIWKDFLTRSLCEYWHPPECHLYEIESGFKTGGDKDKFLARRAKKQKQNDKRTVHLEKNPQFDFFGKTQNHQNFRKDRNRGPPRNTLFGSIRRTRFTQLTFSSTMFSRSQNWNTHLRKKMKDKGDTSATKYGTLSKIFTSPNQKIKLHPIRRPMSGLCRPHPP